MFFTEYAPPPLKVKFFFGDTLQRTLEREKQLRYTYGLKVEVMWEHEWNEMVKNVDNVKKFLKECDFPERLNPRDALFGGRTNALNLHYAAQPGEKIEYYDFTSLYPFVKKTKTYPVGHPVIILRDFEPLENYFGIARIKVLPPKGLWLPVLPYRVKGKLLFPLCRTCAEEMSKDRCLHGNEARPLTGTWCTLESWFTRS